MNVDAALLAILACPACRSRLVVAGDDAQPELACTGCDRVYPVRDDIPVLLVEEARRTGHPTGPHGADAADGG